MTKVKANCNCPICKATPKIILQNNVAKFIVKKKDRKWLDRGFSSMHYWIRAGEMLFNAGFKRYNCDECYG